MSMPGTFVETSMPVVKYYRRDNKVIEVDSTQTVEQVYEDLKGPVAALLGA
jgi:UMP-CMP kinase